MQKVIKQTSQQQSITKETMEMLQKETDCEKSELMLPEILPNERCKLTITLASQKEPKYVFYSLSCADNHYGITHYLFDKSIGSFKLCLENNTDKERKISIQYLIFF